MFISIWIIEMDMCTVIEAACRFDCVHSTKYIGCSNYCAHIHLYISCTDERTPVSHTWDDKNFNDCFLQLCTPYQPKTCSSLRMLKHYFNFNKVCACVGVQCNNCIVRHGDGYIRAPVAKAARVCLLVLQGERQFSNTWDRSILFNVTVNSYDNMAPATGKWNMSVKHWWNDTDRKT